MLCNDFLGVYMYTRANFRTSRTRRYGKMDSFRFDDKVVVTFEEKKQSTKEFEYTYTIIYKTYIYSFVFSTKIPFFLFSLSSSFLYINSYIFLFFVQCFTNIRKYFSLQNTITVAAVFRSFVQIQFVRRRLFEIFI